MLYQLSYTRIYLACTQGIEPCQQVLETRSPSLGTLAQSGLQQEHSRKASRLLVSREVTELD